MHEGVDGLLFDKSRPPGKTPIPPKRVAEIVRLTQEPPPHEATHWTVRAMAKAVGIAASTVQAIWNAHGLSPHRFRQFKLSNDPAFAEKLTEIVGLYVDPPAHAVVLSFDESRKSRRLTAPSPACRLRRVEWLSALAVISPVCRRARPKHRRRQLLRRATHFADDVGSSALKDSQTATSIDLGIDTTFIRSNLAVGPRHHEVLIGIGSNDRGQVVKAGSVISASDKLYAIRKNRIKL